MTRRAPNNPLIAIVGATGTGKSELAVQLARRYNGEIINGDAMQLYAGLPIITNKITAEEQQGIPHHLLGCIGLQEQTWVVSTFVKEASKVIEEIRARGKLPILVGGTHYYTQSLLFHDKLADAGPAEEDGYEDVEQIRQQWPILDEPTEVLLEELQKVDPVMAERWHPNDRRKISRSLEIYLRTGKKASDVYAEQRSKQKSSSDDEADRVESPSMRFDTLLFWVHADADALRTRLDERVDKMLAAGLLEEVRTLNAHADPQVDETRGIWVSIGYKEFRAYVQALDLNEAEEKLRSEAVERTKIATRQYAKRQVRWIRIKLLNALSAASASDKLFLLDGSDASNFSSAVVEPASELTDFFLQASPLPEPRSLSGVAAEQLQLKREYDVSSRIGEWTKQHCDVCGVTCVIPEQWEKHVGSKAHKKAVSKKRAREAGDGGKYGVGQRSGDGSADAG